MRYCTAAGELSCMRCWVNRILSRLRMIQIKQRLTSGRALLMMDKLAKNFLQACWRLREALVGKLRVEHSD